MLQSGHFTDDELVEHFLTFLAAGHETVAATFGWSIYLLAKSLSVQTRLREEVQPLYSRHNAERHDTTSNPLDDLPLLNAVCNEVIRLYPSVPLTPQIAVCNTSVLGYPVPKGTRVMAAPCAINRAPHLWGPTADDFDPDRWIDRESGRISRTGGAESIYSSLTFLHGPHGCIGSEYAKAELRETIAAFVGAFEMDVARPGDLVVPSGRLATRPGNKDGELLIRLKSIQSDVQT